MRESVIQSHFIRRVKETAVGLAFKVNADGVRGFPDVLFITRTGETAYIEFKQAKGRLSAHQKEMHRALIDLGADVMVINSLELADKLIDLTLAEYKRLGII
jgi:hypothetical protein